MVRMSRAAWTKICSRALGLKKRGYKINAIKVLRDATGCYIIEAKHAVEKLR